MPSPALFFLRGRGGRLSCVKWKPALTVLLAWEKKEERCGPGILLRRLWRRELSLVAGTGTAGNVGQRIHRKGQRS